MIAKITCDDDLNVKIAYFTSNSLSDLKCLGEMKKAVYIALDDNKLSNLSAESFKNLRKTTTLKISNIANLNATAEMFSPLKKLNELWVDELINGYENLEETFPDKKCTS